MYFRVLDENFLDLITLDTYTNVLWVERYFEAGEFIVETPATPEYLDVLGIGRYIWSSASETLMIIRSQKIVRTIQQGDILQISGESLDSILESRIIWDTTTINSDFETGLNKLINDNLINPSIAARKVSNMSIIPSGDARIKAIKLDFQATGDNLYDLVSTLCSIHNVGFKVMFDGTDKFKIQYYMGQNRSRDQFENPYVIFSPEFDNLKDSEYIDDALQYKNVALIAGEEPEGKPRTRTSIGTATGLDRFELYVDARDIQSETPDGIYPPEEYQKLLVSRGNQKLDEYTRYKNVTGSVEDSRTFVYGRDYFLGDVVQVENNQGLYMLARVTEIVYTRTVGSESLIPTFAIEEGSDTK